MWHSMWTTALINFLWWYVKPLCNSFGWRGGLNLYSKLKSYFDSSYCGQMARHLPVGRTQFSLKFKRWEMNTTKREVLPQLSIPYISHLIHSRYHFALFFLVVNLSARIIWILLKSQQSNHHGARSICSRSCWAAGENWGITNDVTV